MKISIDQTSFTIDKGQVADFIVVCVGILEELVKSKVLPDQWTIRILLLTNVLSMILKPLVTPGTTKVDIDASPKEVAKAVQSVAAGQDVTIVQSAKEAKPKPPTWTTPDDID